MTNDHQNSKSSAKRISEVTKRMLTLSNELHEQIKLNKLLQEKLVDVITSDPFMN